MVPGLRRLSAIACLLFLLLAVPAQATFPGANGRIAFSAGVHGPPDWSPSGKLIVFGTNSQRVGSSVFTIRPDGSGLARVTPDRYPQNAIGPVFSPGGDRIAFSDDRRYSDHCCLDLFSVGLDGKGKRPIPLGKGGGIFNAAWGSAPLLGR